MIRLFTILIVACGLVACQPAPPTSLEPTEPFFPTVTLGHQVAGILVTPQPRTDNAAQVNPATAVAVSNRPTPTPDRGSCPQAVDNAQLEESPATREGAINAMLAFLNAGGTPAALERALISRWRVFGDDGYFRSDVDLTGENTPELVLGYIAPGDVGTLLILGCDAGQYVQRYEAITDGSAPPQLLRLSDVNANPPNDVAFVRQQCVSVDVCELQTQIITWNRAEGRFVNLLNEPLFTLDAPTLRDMDEDRVEELVVSLGDNGTTATGPLRTGVNIYDWNGSAYVLSITQLEPPRYRIQYIHEADEAFSRQQMREAEQLYRVALSDNADFRYWFNDGETTVRSYAYYRLILVYAFNNDPQQLFATVAQMTQDFGVIEDGNPPVYIEMANRFADVLTITNDLHEACVEVQTIIDANEDALDLLNRYGSRSPTYTALDLCPF